VACFAVAPLRREPSHRAAWKTSGRYLLSGLVFPAFAPSLIALTIRPTLAGADGLVIAHLSDLHLCVGTTMEGGLPARAARAALHWCFEQKADLVVLSGDITDSGREEEWQVLHGLLAVADRSRPTPGHSRESRPHDHPGDLPGDRWAARPGPREAVPLLCPTRPRPPLASRVVFHGDRSGSLREMLRRCEDYALAYDRTPPRLGTQREQRRGLGAQLRQIMRPGDRATSRRPRDLREYVPPVIVPDALAAEAARDRGTSWPTVDQPLYRDLLELVYPITLYEDARYVVVGLNSNTIPALSIVDGAIGMLGRGQLDRLEGLLRARSGKCALLVLHHHLGCPPEILSRLKVSPLEVKVLQLADTARLRGILSSHARVVVFHGHKHVGYWADLERIRVISAPSVAYGNRVGPHNCHVYAVDPEGQVSLVVSTQISASPRAG
jgi:3',5'-cyclic AMP phosphodiesterase CpdA